MSLPYEQVMAQKRVWDSFVEGKLSRKLWPKHFMGASELKMLFQECEEQRIRSEVYRELLLNIPEEDLESMVEKRIKESSETLRMKINFNGWSE
jgi:hypothetical protein